MAKGKASTIELSAAERRELETLTRRRKTGPSAGVAGVDRSGGGRQSQRASPTG